MTIRRACASFAAVLAALVLSGCFVISKNLPAGQPVHDTRLVGAWQGMKGESNEPDDVFFHFQDTGDKEPLRLIWVEDRNYQVYEVTTLRIGARDVFAAKLISSIETKGDEKRLPPGYFLGVYDVAQNGMDISFRLLDSEKVGELIKTGVLKGVPPPAKYDFATLTGSPDEIARYLAASNLDKGLVDEAAHLRRLAPFKK